MRYSVLAFVLLQSLIARADAPAQLFVTDGAKSSATYKLVHKFHKVSGVSHKVEAKARILASGQAQVMLRVPSESFDSGNVNRDEHMKETVESARYPNIEIKGVTDGLQMPASFPATLEKSLKAVVDFHGVQRQQEIPVQIVFESATRIHAVCHFSISLDAFKIDRPALLFIKVDDKLDLDSELTFNRVDSPRS
jgi:hypothetical protein